MNAFMTKTRFEDQHIGKRVRARRKMLGLTQTVVADRCGIKFQQLQKYETGINRISGSRLCDLAKALNVNPGYFFEGIGEEFQQDAPQTADEAAIVRNMRKMPVPAQRALLNISQAVVDARQSQSSDLAEMEMRENFNAGCV